MHADIPSWLWLTFAGLVTASLAFDLGIQGRRHAQMTLPQASRWVAFWVSLALAFNVLIYAKFGRDRALEFLSAYLIEQSLSMDNLFVFLMIFRFFQVPAMHQATVLKWGILGAVVMRLLLIFTGVELLKRFHWIFYVFGALLLYTAWAMWRDQDEKVDPAHNPLLRLMQRVMRFTPQFHGGRFFVREQGALLATPLFATLVVIEASDLVFAVDSIPAVLAISDNAFIIYTSNIFAILGLRALYFVLQGFMDLFHYLKHGLSFILAFIGLKMLLSGVVHVPIAVSLGVVLTVLTISVLASLVRRRRLTA